MGRVREFSPEKLIIGVLSSRLEHTEDLRGRLVSRFGPTDYESPVLDFSFTDYYDQEMGQPIYRFFFSFSYLVNPDTLSDIKLFTNDLEELYQEDGQRKINLDPGLLSLSRLILATTKDNAHRIPLADGIYGEITLLFRKKRFLPLEWTYPDFRSDEYNEVLLTVRNLLKEQVNQNPDRFRY